MNICVLFQILTRASVVSSNVTMYQLRNGILSICFWFGKVSLSEFRVLSWKQCCISSCFLLCLISSVYFYIQINVIFSCLCLKYASIMNIKSDVTPVVFKFWLKNAFWNISRKCYIWSRTKLQNWRQKYKIMSGDGQWNRPLEALFKGFE